MFLYRILNIVDKKEYVGITNNIPRRWKEHKIELKGDRHHNAHLQAAWNAHGEKNFSFDILSNYFNLEDMRKAEVEYIEQNNLLNKIKIVLKNKTHRVV